MRTMPKPESVTVTVTHEPVAVGCDPDEAPAPWVQTQPGPPSLRVEILHEDGSRLEIDTGPLTDQFEMTYLDPPG
jgi:hypothetical protein